MKNILNHMSSQNLGPGPWERVIWEACVSVLVERSKSGKRFKFKKMGHPKISVVLGISGRTFKIRKNRSSEN